jgi:hypothetical protein
MTDHGQYPSGHGYAWRGDWGARLFDIVRSRGFDTLTAFAQAHPLATLGELTSLIGEGDVAPIQIQRVLIEEARESGTLGQCAKGLLVRLLREVKAGWPPDRSWNSQKAVRRRIISWRVSLGDDCDEVANRMMRDLLDTLDLPAGWLPSGPDDPVITALFERHWPHEPGANAP